MPGHDGGLPDRELTCGEGGHSVGELGTAARDPDHVVSLGGGQAGANHEEVLGRAEPAIAPVATLDQLRRDVHELAVCPVQPARDLRSPLPQVAGGRLVSDSFGGGRHALIVHLFEQQRKAKINELPCNTDEFADARRR
jgi:hypothetical protein